MHGWARLKFKALGRQRQLRAFFLDKDEVEAAVTESDRVNYYHFIEETAEYCPKLTYHFALPAARDRPPTRSTPQPKLVTPTSKPPLAKRLRGHSEEVAREKVGEKLREACEQYVERARHVELEAVASSSDPLAAAGVVYSPAQTQTLKLHQQLRARNVRIEDLQRRVSELERQNEALLESKADAEAKKNKQYRHFFTKLFHDNGKAKSLKNWFGLTADFSDLVALLGIFHEGLEEEHSKDERKCKLTQFEQCLLAKACVGRCRCPCCCGMWAVTTSSREFINSFVHFQ
jgi:hypothetical protein